MTVLKNNDVNVILDISYGYDTLNSVSQHIKVANIFGEVHIYSNACVLLYLQQVDARVIIAWLPPSPSKLVTEFWCMVRMFSYAYVGNGNVLP